MYFVYLKSQMYFVYLKKKARNQGANFSGDAAGELCGVALERSEESFPSAQTVGKILRIAQDDRCEADDRCGRGICPCVFGVRMVHW